MRARRRHAPGPSGPWRPVDSAGRGDRVSSALRVDEAPEAPLGRSDPTRRWGLRDARGGLRFPGLTRPEALRVADLLDDGGTPRALARVALPVVLSDGAGPHLLDADGRLTLAVGPHPGGDGWRVAIGEASPAQRIGVVVPDERDALVWHWVAVREVVEPDRVSALDALLACADRARLTEWQGGQGPM